MISCMSNEEFLACMTVRVWEKFHEKMQEAAAEISGIKRVLGKWAKDVAFHANTDILNK